jgi:hypothetical protein
LKEEPSFTLDSGFLGSRIKLGFSKLSLEGRARFHLRLRVS